MKHKIIVRLKIKGKLDKVERELKYLFDYTLESIMKQTNKEYCCIVEYPEEAETLFNDEKQKYPDIASNIIFTRSMRDEVKALLEASNLSGYDDIWFVTIRNKQVCPLDMIEKFNQYIPGDRTKILLLQEGYLYTPSEKKLYKIQDNHFDSYVYVCGIEEYRKHFVVYDYYYPKVLEEKYLLLKNEVFPEKLLVISQEMPSKKYKQLLQLEEKDVKKVLGNFEGRGV